MGRQQVSPIFQRTSSDCVYCEVYISPRKASKLILLHLACRWLRQGLFFSNLWGSVWGFSQLGKIQRIRQEASEPWIVLASHITWFHWTYSKTTTITPLSKWAKVSAGLQTCVGWWGVKDSDCLFNDCLHCSQGDVEREHYASWSTRISSKRESCRIFFPNYN